jgi:hypothetical protein
MKRTSDPGLPSTPANFRSDLASRQVDRPSIRLSRPTTSIQQKETFLKQLRTGEETQEAQYEDSNIPSNNRSIREGSTSEIPLATSDRIQQYFNEQYPPSTPRKQVYTFGLTTPQAHTFSFNPYQHPQRTPLHTDRIVHPPQTPIHNHLPSAQSEYFSAERVRPSTDGNIFSSASGVRNSQIPVGPTAVSSPYSRDQQQSNTTRNLSSMTSNAVSSRRRGISPVRTRTNSRRDFVAGLTLHGGRR